MAGSVISGEGVRCGEEVDLTILLSDILSEMVEVRNEVEGLRVENKLLKEEINKLKGCSVSSGGVSGGDGCLGGGGVGEGDAWKVVHRGGGARMKLRRAPVEAVSCSNSFSVLSDEVPQETGEADAISRPQGKKPFSQGKTSVTIVGDSLCRHLGKVVRSKLSGNFYYPGAGIRKIVESLDGLVDGNSAVCLVVGGNDINRRRSEELLEQYKLALEKVRRKGAPVVACGIPPRMGYSREWLSRAIAFNSRIEDYCRRNRIAYVDVWERFYGRKQLFARDGVHLSRVGVSVLSGLIDKVVGGFR